MTGAPVRHSQERSVRVPPVWRSSTGTNNAQMFDRFHLWVHAMTQKTKEAGTSLDHSFETVSTKPANQPTSQATEKKP